MKDHQQRLIEIKKRMSEESAGRVTRINEVLGKLTASEQEYIKMSILRKVEGI